MLLFCCITTFANAYSASLSYAPKHEKSFYDSLKLKRWGRAYHLIAVEVSPAVSFSSTVLLSSDVDKPTLTGFQISALYKYHFTKTPLAVQTEINYENEKRKSINFYESNTTVRNYLSIPLLFKIEFIRKYVTAGLYFGPAVNLLLGNYYRVEKYNSGYWNSQYHSWVSYATDKKIGAGIVLGFNVTVPIGRGLGFILDPRLNPIVLLM